MNNPALYGSEPKRVREGVERDLYLIMTETPEISTRQALQDADYGPVYARCEMIVDRLTLLVGTYTSTAVQLKVEIALREGVAGLKDPLRRQAAEIMLGLRTGPGQKGAKPTDRRKSMAKLYADAKASRTNEQVLQRSELPEIRKELADSLLEAEQMFTRARRSDSALRRQRRNQAKNAEKIQWADYDEKVADLARYIKEAEQAVPLDAAAEDWSAWAIVAIGRGGMPLATHLSHQLGIGMVGFASIWDYHSRSGENRVVVDALYTPAQDAQGLPRKFIVVDDIVTTGIRMQRIITELRNRYPQPIDVYQASLLRSVDEAGSAHKNKEQGRGPKIFYAAAARPQTWYELPWEAPSAGTTP